MKRRSLLIAAMLILLSAALPFMAADAGAGQQVMVAAKDAAAVELYVTDWCPYCRKAIDFFRARGISPVIYDIEKDGAAARRKNELDSRRGVPFAVVNGVRIHGFSEAAYQKALDNK